MERDIRRRMERILRVWIEGYNGEVAEDTKSWDIRRRLEKGTESWDTLRRLQRILRVGI